MFTKLSVAAAALAMTAGAIVPATAADAQSYRSRHYRGDRYYDRDYRAERGYRDYRGYNDYRASRRCKSGDTGTIVGAIAGGLLGRTIDTRGSRVTGTILGAGAGALAGRAIERSGRPGYCR